MKHGFTQILGGHLFYDVMPNSYYDDENTNDCETPDYDEAYRVILDANEISKDDLEDVFYDPESSLEFTGLDLLKIAVEGDFNTEFDSNSDMGLNLQALNALTRLLEDNPKVWDSFSNPNREIGMERSEWKKHNAQSTPLAAFAYNRVKDCSRTHNMETFKLCKSIADKLSKYKTFGPQKVKNGNRYNTLKTIFNEYEDPKEKEKFLETTKKLAGYAKNGQYKKLISYPDNFSRHHHIKDAAIQHLIFGKSQDEFFEEIAKDVKNIREEITAKVKEEAKEAIDLS
jgi:hypothetical protein